ncbi:MAG TPA: hypothetical protein EYP49_20795 [Anaerolineae bacterium]|nr:hypothetical protein [Anaerolineae bacterium]
MDRSTKARMKALLAELDYDFSRFTLGGFARWLAKRRKRQINFVPWEMPPNPSGAWVAGASQDYIFYDRDAQPIHQTHIKLHEMAHMLCGHPTVRVESEQALFLPAEPAISRVLLRSIHSDQEELEAETLATLIQGQILRCAGRHELDNAISWDRDFAGNFSSYIHTVELDK